MTRQCGHCGASIEGRHGNAQYCADAECQRQRKVAFGRESYDRHRDTIAKQRAAAYAARKAAKPPAPARFCAFCGKQTSRQKWCDLRCRDKFRHRANPSRARDKIARAREADPERLRAITARWRERNPDRYLDQARKAQQKRRAWKLGTGGDMSHRSWHRLLVRYDFSCAYCGRRPVRLVQEHVIPLARGGRHGEGNIVPACQPCNNSKADRLLIEWRAGRRISRPRAINR